MNESSHMGAFCATIFGADEWKCPHLHSSVRCSSLVVNMLHLNAKCNTVRVVRAFLCQYVARYVPLNVQVQVCTEVNTGGNIHHATLVSVSSKWTIFWSGLIFANDKGDHTNSQNPEGHHCCNLWKSHHWPLATRIDLAWSPFKCDQYSRSNLKFASYSSRVVLSGITDQHRKVPAFGCCPR